MKDIFFDDINDKIKSRDNFPNWANTYLPIHKQINLIRTALGITQKQLAKKVKTSQTAIARLEQGLTEPNLATIKKITEAFGCDFFSFIVPPKKLKQILDDKINQKAKEILSFSDSSSALELQKPNSTQKQRQLELLKKELFEKKRSILWDE
ncbi:MAG: helix-turn-helix domain-containing protein [Candidatus Margulisiibacteriota bacterium]|jgi:transcriptional regulator with XRE-family HTH domain